jgi:hypothetical protein
MINEYNDQIRAGQVFVPGVLYGGVLDGFEIHVEPARSEAKRSKNICLDAHDTTANESFLRSSLSTLRHKACGRGTRKRQNGLRAPNKTLQLLLRQQARTLNRSDSSLSARRGHTALSYWVKLSSPIDTVALARPQCGAGLSNKADCNFKITLCLRPR